MNIAQFKNLLFLPIILSASCFSYNVKNGNVDSVRSALDGGRDINEKDADGNTPLILAANSKQHQMLKFLLERGARIDDVNFKGQSALSRSVSWNDTQGSRILLEKKPSVNQQDMDGWTPLLSATIVGNEETAMILIEHKADTEVQTKLGYKLLNLAAGSCMPELVSYLLERNVDPDTRDSDGKTPMMALCKFSLNGAVYQASSPFKKPTSITIAKLLLEKKANIHATDNAGRTPLHGAIFHTDFELVNFLLQKGADVNSRDKFDGTPLMKSVNGMLASTKIIKLLLENGADKTAVDKKEKTARDYAEANKLPQVFVDLLR